MTRARAADQLAGASPSEEVRNALPEALTVLIVDDDAQIRQLLTEVVQRDGHLAITAGDGVEALKVVMDRRPTFLLADLHMPRMNGLTLIRAARAVLPEIRAVLISGAASVEDAVEAIREGAEDYFSKPLDLPRLRKFLLSQRPTFDASDQGVVSTTSTGDAESYFGQLPQLTGLLPHLVGSFCHDLSGHLSRVHLALNLARSDAALQALNGAIEAVESLREFLSPLRNDTLRTELISLNRAAVHAAIELLLAREVHGDSVSTKVVVGDLVPRARLPRFVFEALLVPLIQNAQRSVLDASRREHGGQITVTAKALHEDRTVQLTVADDGLGWSNRILELSKNMTDPNWPRRPNAPRGEGLRNVYRLTRLMGGTVNLRDASPVGAVVEILLPYER